MLQFRKLCLAAAGVALVVLVAGLATARPDWWQPAAVVFSAGLAVGLGAVPSWKGYQFTAWVLTAVTTAMLYPERFLHVGGIDLRNKWIILLIVQSVMFGMGTQMSLKDFAGVMKTPWGAFVGVLCHFVVMPLVGYGLIKAFHFPDEIAAGIILIGACSSGLASSVMVYLARGNLALAITITSVSTLLAPIMTPLWMKVLAGTLVKVVFFDMMIEVIKIVIVPIGAAMLHDYLKFASPQGKRVVYAVAAAGVAWLAFLALGGWERIATGMSPSGTTVMALLGFLLAAAVVGVAYHHLTLLLPVIDRYMPLVSMFGIIYFTAVTTAAGRDNLLKVGGLLFLAAAIHNTAGYFFGYWLSRLLGMDRISARTVAFEVGLQNGGMASGLAGAMGKLGTVGLAAAVFSPWMNISGSILANYWRKRPPTENEDAETNR